MEVEQEAEPTTHPDPEIGPSRQVERRAVSPSEFGTVMAHFYRGEISRANIWRQRLDATFNWAVLTTGTTLSFAFGTPSSPHYVILLNSLLVAVFLFIEARRYRYYELWTSRIRVIETDYLAPMLSRGVREATPHEAWREHLAEDLLRPRFTVGLWEAVGRRLRRNYLWIFLLLAVAWNIKVLMHPEPAKSLAEFLNRAEIGTLDGPIVIAIGFIYNGLLLTIAFTTIRLSGVTSADFYRRRRGYGRRRRRRTPDTETSATFKPVKRQGVGNTGTLESRDDE
jgi:uncharacterized membrane protein